MPERDVTWDGFFNARDLGGLPTAGGRSTRPGVLVRSADPRFVTPAGWRAARAAGFRTVLDLRNDDEVEGVLAPPGLTRVRVALDHAEDVEFWRYLDETGLNGTPLYIRPFLARKPERVAAAVTAIARAEPGGVIFHCGAGRDRTGVVAMLLLALAGVAPEVIADDYEESAAWQARLAAATGREDWSPLIVESLAGKGHTVRSAMLDALSGFDAAAYLTAAGVATGDLARLRTLLIT
ncbi:tyrosine-protein phosphatase [Dactylosporangium sp. CS-047395]|uniref:tyrosine-protein phosphatase n=1 Tax=Dactylosporangium sp. CS-047395 TaxID=3239936 RepID=UPI003D93BE07